MKWRNTKSNKCNILWLAYKQGQIFERFKLNKKFVNMVNKLGLVNPLWFFEILIVKFMNKYPRMKKSSHSLHFLKNNFKIIK